MGWEIVGMRVQCGRGEDRIVRGSANLEDVVDEESCLQQCYPNEACIGPRGEVTDLRI